MNLRKLLLADLERQFYYEGRTGVKPSIFRIIIQLSNVRFVPIVIFRLAHYFSEKRVPLLGKLLSIVNFVLFGLEIAVRCEIGPGLYLPHTQGTVIGAWRIGRNAVIYHQVTLGAKVINIGYDRHQRPVIGNDVVIGSGAKVLGGIEIGDDVTVGANAVVTCSVPDCVIVAGIPARIIRHKLAKGNGEVRLPRGLGERDRPC